jgi:hypothetical protein
MPDHIPTHVLALGDRAQINLNLGHGQNVGGSRHVDQELYHSIVSNHQLTIPSVLL